MINYSWEVKVWNNRTCSVFCCRRFKPPAAHLTLFPAQTSWYSSLSTNRAKAFFFSSERAVNSSPLLHFFFFFFFTKRSVFDWGLKVSFGVFLLKHLWLQLCGQKLTIKPSTPLEITEIFYQASEHPFSFRGLKCFHVHNNFVYSVCIHAKLQQGDNKLAANCSGG